MPILWKYLLKNYFKVFFLSVTGFISVLLVMRVQEIARFATLNTSFTSVVLFTLYQLPYILPFAIPISGLLASFLLTQSMSHSHELTSLRASGFPLKILNTPLLLSAGFLSLANFMIVSELSPFCRLKSASLLYDTVSSNPLILFKKNKFVNIPDSFVDLKFTDRERMAKDFIFVFLDPAMKKLSLVTANHLALEGPLLIGKELNTLSVLQNHPTFDDILIENQETMHINAKDLSSLLQKSKQALNYDYLSTKGCILHILAASTPRHIAKEGLFELYKRLFFAFIPITFVFLGTHFGISIGREKNSKKLRATCLLTLLLFICYLVGKAMHESPKLALLAYLIPHAFIIYLSIRNCRKLERGVE